MGIVANLFSPIFKKSVKVGPSDNSSYIVGLEDMHALTSDGRRYQLRVDLQAANGTHYYEIYDDFYIGPANNFTLHVGSHRGTAGWYMYGSNSTLYYSIKLF